MALPKLPSFGRGPRALVPLILAVVAIGGGALIIGQVQQVKQLQQQLELSRQQLAKLDSQNQELSQQLETLQGQRKDLEQRLSSLRTQFSAANTDLERSHTDLKDLQARYQQVLDERTQLQAQVTSITGERNEAKQRLEQVERENAEIERSVSRLRERLALLDRDYRQMASKLAEVESRPNSDLNVAASVGQTSAANASPAVFSPNWSRTPPTSASTVPGAVELPPIIVRRDQAGVSSILRGKVLEVNEPQNFIIMDKGSADGVRIGMVFNVLRGSGSVGRVSVIRVRPQLSAGEVIRSSTPGALQIGDTAIQAGS